MITRLVLKNWRSHEESAFEFAKGTNVLVGPMGAGKSATMDAISFALFGTFPNVQNRKIKLDDIIMSKPTPKSKASVELTFKIDNNSYLIKRVLERGKGVTTSELRRGDTLVEGPQTKRTTEKICELLKMNYDLFSRAVYAEQNNIDYFLEIPKGQRKDRIDELLNINKFELARKNLGTVINRLRDRTEEKQRFVSEIKEIDNIPKLEAEIGEKKRLRDKKKLVVEDFQKQRLAASTEHSTLAKKKKEYDGLKTKIEGLRAVTERDSNSIEDCKKKLNSIKVILDIDKKIGDSKISLENIRKDIEDKKSTKKSLAMHVSHIEESVVKIGEGKEKCPVCDSDISGHKKDELLQRRGEDKRETLKKIEEIDVEVLELDRERRNLDENIELLQKNSDQVKRITDDKTKLEGELEKNRKSLTELAGTLQKLDYDERREKSVYEKLKEVEKNLAVVEREQYSLTEIIGEKEERLAELTKIQKELLDTRNEIIYLQKTVGSFETLQNVLQNVQSSLRQEFTDTTNMALSDIWAKIYPYKDYVDLKLNVDESGDYILQMKTKSGEWQNVEGITSGGERSCACLALRIALSFVLARNLSWLVLDEPTHNLDKKAISELSKILRDDLPQIVEQIFVITHEPELEKAASGFLYRLERNKGEDEPTRVNAETAVGFA